MQMTLSFIELLFLICSVGFKIPGELFLNKLRCWPTIFLWNLESAVASSFSFLFFCLCFRIKESVYFLTNEMVAHLFFTFVSKRRRWYEHLVETQSLKWDVTCKIRVSGSNNDISSKKYDKITSILPLKTINDWLLRRRAVISFGPGCILV